MGEMEIQFTPRDMLQAMSLRPRPTTFLSDMLLKGRSTSDKTVFQLDQDFGGQTKAGYVNREGDPTEVAKNGYKSTLHVAPYIDERITLTPKDVDVRNIGVNQYSTSGSNILAQRTARWLADLQDRFVRAEEDQVATALQTGKIAVTGKDVDYEIDFGVPASHIIDLSGSAPWSAANTIAGQLEDWAGLVGDDGGMGVTDLICGTNAARAFMNDTQIQGWLNNRRIERGEINPRQLSAQRASYLANLAGDGLDIDVWSYKGGYKVGSTFYRYLDPDSIILVARDIAFDMQYAKIENFNGDFIGERFPQFYFEKRGKKGYIELESSPMATLRDPLSFVTAKVLP